MLVFDEQTSERRLRLIEEEEEFRRVRRLHPHADEALLRALRDNLEDRFQSAALQNNGGDWQRLLAKWDDTLSNALQLAPQKGTLAGDLDADHIGVHRAPARVGTPDSRARSVPIARRSCGRRAGSMEKSVHAAEFTFPDDPMRLDYS